MKLFKNILLFVFISINLSANKKVENMIITINSKGNETKFKLNNSKASKELQIQLPLNIDIEDYASMEKIFYPPNKLNISNTPLANAKKGTLAYYAPWGNVVMFYKDFGSANGLYELGSCIDGCENISNISGKLEIK